MFESDALVPHAVCWAAAPHLIWTMVITNFITFLSYLTIASTLWMMARKTRRVMAPDWAYFVVGFALFILACGTTHLLEVITTWTPVFWIDAWTNIITAGLSAYVAFMLIRRAGAIAYGVNDYAGRLADTESEKLRMQDSLLSAQKLEDWSRMSTLVSHEIRNPLQAIQNLQFIIRNSEGVSAQVMEMTNLVEAEAQRVLAIADATLSFIRQTTRPEGVDLREVVDSARFVLGPITEKRGVALEVVSKGDCKIEAFAGETRQVLLNVMRNACEAITKGGVIKVQVEGEDSAVRVVVTDDGPGIAEEMLPHIFEFGTTTKGEKGSGMGLWMVKHLVQKHGGAIHVASSAGKGTTVELEWPRHYRSLRLETGD